MAKDAKGKFISEGTEDYVPMNPLEKWEHEYNMIVDSGAAANVAKYVTEPTGLAQGRDRGGALGDQEIVNRRWTLFGGIFRPRDPLAGVIDISADIALAVQVQIGEQTTTGILPINDRRVVATGSLIVLLHTEGCTAVHWPMPLDILRPRPLYADDLTVVVNASADLPELRNIEWIATLMYAVADGEMADQLQYLQRLRS